MDNVLHFLVVVRHRKAKNKSDSDMACEFNQYKFKDKKFPTH